MMQRFLDLFISISCSTCFRRFLRPLSGGQNCTYSVRYCQTNTVACCDNSRQQYWFHISRKLPSPQTNLSQMAATVKEHVKCE